MNDNDIATFAIFMDIAMHEVVQINEQNGWFDSDRRFGEDIALLHSEVSEALEEFRVHGLQRYVNEPIPGTPSIMPMQFRTRYLDAKEDYLHLKPQGVPSEAADILVRLLDFCFRYKINLVEEFYAKLEYNKTRGYRHGNKAL